MANEILLNALDMPSDLSIARLYLDITKTKIFCHNIAENKCYIFDLKLKVYREQRIGEITRLVQAEIETFIINKYRENRDQRLMKGFLRILTMIGSMDKITKIIKNIFVLCQDKSFVDKLNTDRDTINFKNGILNLKTGKFRKRTEKDFVSKHLSYDYSEEQDIKLINHLATTIRQICNDDEEIFEFNLSWIGYCMTGHTKEQVFLCTTGHTASNGKSTLLKLYANCLDIYYQKADSGLFCKNFPKRYKHLTDIKAPVRLIGIEELDDKPLDTTFVKDFVDGDKIGGNEVLYGTVEDIHLQCKAQLVSNKTPKFPPDHGLKRRLLLQYFINRFAVK